MFHQLKMGHKLWFAVAAIVVLLVAVVGFSGFRSAKTQAEGNAILQEVSMRHDAVVHWAGLTETNAVRTLALVLSEEPAVQAEFKDAIAATSAKIGEVQKSLEAMPLSDREKAQMEKIAAARKNMATQRDQARKLKAAGQADQAETFVRQTYNPASAAYLKTLGDFVELEKQIMQETRNTLAQAGMDTVKIAAAAVGALLLAIIVGAFYLIRSIAQPLEQANALAGRIAEGDLSHTETITRGDEFGELLRSLYIMSDSLGRMVHQVRQSTDSIAIASAEIATGNHDLSMRTEETSSNLQETAAAMEQFTSTIQQSASSAQQASSLAAGATGVARRGGDVVTQVVATMEDINHSSKKIADIIGVIDGIAFQTNILALNAAVEAARAGEQGRGFAVVASEVRSLAQRSAEAAKEIKQLINASVEKVETGSRLVSDAGTTMTDIVQSVQRVTDMIGEITTASSEQSAGVSQVNQSIGNLDQMTQQNAALVEESAAAAQSLREQADQLAQVVSRFKVNAAGYAPAQAAIAAARATSAVRQPSPMAAPKPTGKAVGARPSAASAHRPALTQAAPPAKAPAAATVAASGRKPVVAQGGDEDWESF
ncbi:methyl-accepting chemotaxis protein [Acidovorax radicis]|jgi:methyl-accepting chemotaxis protein|uniref:methyl-accepting chemotaxis protein n=1 Tax=Acidovorax radicis TaxID=758826 RepID=UPI001CFA0754|nr:methyl-accepting chemotaxis protein [Acidovorax radicis]UCV00687.1 MCP four helix bundle domain-containing protein [Acidovorax radicis]